MRFLRYLFLAVLAIVLVSVALANREIVTLTLFPPAIADLWGRNFSINMPLFIVILIGIVSGLLIGFVWEYFREHKHRSEARRKTQEKKQLEREVKRLKNEKTQGQDEVLALLE
ncbi:lipopolysaccharide assembly LapA domain-containing protein [Pseudooceanicola sp. LIPI14-2-Ac024]|uniref:LapA family protein n=1 Tax=Pseudooceanicola sp. LIPI14-2-Ac024 TaxID=3344875 RepID=UPI0035CF5113